MNRFQSLLSIPTCAATPRSSPVPPPRRPQRPPPRLCRRRRPPSRHGYPEISRRHPRLPDRPRCCPLMGSPFDSGGVRGVCGACLRGGCVGGVRGVQPPPATPRPSEHPGCSIESPLDRQIMPYDAMVPIVLVYRVERERGPLAHGSANSVHCSCRVHAIIETIIRSILGTTYRSSHWQ
jgi:hypothetical protein